MSVVVVRVKKNKIEFASDSITIYGDTQEKAKDKYMKLVEVNDMVLGAVGLCQETHMFQMFCATRKPEACSDLEVLNFFCDFLDWQKKKTDKYGTDNHYLFGFAGKVFQIKGFFVKEILDFAAIGAGMDFALAALHLEHDVKKAVSVSCELSVWCEKPIQFISMEGGHNEEN